MSGMTSPSFEHKVQRLKGQFASLQNAQKYELLMEMGRRLPPYPEALKTPERVVSGCQSTLYLAAALKEEKIEFIACSEALISSGLAALLVAVYSGESPEVVLQCPPTFLEELGIFASLSAGRSNGLYHIHLRMKQEALKIFSCRFSANLA